MKIRNEYIKYEINYYKIHVQIGLFKIDSELKRRDQGRNQGRHTGKRGQNGTCEAPLGPFTLSQMGLSLRPDFDHLISIT